jgi:hypothetical protein
MEGQLVKFVENEPVMHTLALDNRDWEILQDVLEAHFDSLNEILRDCVTDDETRHQYEDEKRRINRMLTLFDM